MVKEKFELPHYYKPERFMKPKFKSEEKKRKCMTCAKEFISGPNCYIQSIGTVNSRELKKQPSTPEEFNDEKYLLDEEFDN